MSRSAVEAKRRKQRLRTEDLAPEIARGITIGASAKEALDQHPVTPIRPLEQRLRHMHDIGAALRPRFHGETTDTGFVRESLDRRFADAEITFPEEVRRAILAGMICLKCLEPQTSSFADEHLEACEGVLVRGPRYMRDWQIIDCAHEMQGEKHLGPSKPMSEFLGAQDERMEKRLFIKRVLDGGKGRIPKAWLRDAVLMDGLDPEDRRAIGA